MASCFLVLLIQTTSSSSSVSLAIEGAVLRRTSLCLSHHKWKQIRHSATCCWHLTEKNKIIFFITCIWREKQKTRELLNPQLPSKPAAENRSLCCIGAQGSNISHKGPAFILGSWPDPSTHSTQWLQGIYQHVPVHFCTITLSWVFPSTHPPSHSPLYWHKRNSQKKTDSSEPDLEMCQNTSRTYSWLCPLSQEDLVLQIQWKTEVLWEHNSSANIILPISTVAKNWLI